MEKPSSHTLLMWLATLIVIAGAILQIMHQISSGMFRLFLAVSFLLFLLARWLKPKTS